jgi:hypothetical protein
LAVAVDLDDRGVDHGVFHIRIIREGVEEPFEDIGLNPIAIAFENGVPVAKKRWKIAPRAPRSCNPQHRFHEKPIVPTAPPGIARLAQAQHFHLRPLGVSQNESVQRHLATLGMTPEQYRSKWNLPADYPMVAANYAAQRSELAKKMGLGQSRKENTAV